MRSAFRQLTDLAITPGTWELDGRTVRAPGGAVVAEWAHDGVDDDKHAMSLVPQLESEFRSLVIDLLQLRDHCTERRDETDQWAIYDSIIYRIDDMLDSVTEESPQNRLRSVENFRPSKDSSNFSQPAHGGPGHQNGAL